MSSGTLLGCLFFLIAVTRFTSGHSAEEVVRDPVGFDEVTVLFQQFVIDRPNIYGCFPPFVATLLHQTQLAFMRGLGDKPPTDEGNTYQHYQPDEGADR